MHKLLTVVGARPQFIKAAAVSRLIRRRDDVREFIVHTGQHFDRNMSEVFFDQLEIPHPDFNLGISGLSHGAMTGRMLHGLEKLILEIQPDSVMVYGDTNSTLAGALAAAKIHIPVTHVESGLRSNNPMMPEEINRVVTDRLSSLLLCPTDRSVNNLRAEGFPFPATGTGIQIIENTGDVMFDAVLHYRERAWQSVDLEQFGVVDHGYALCTLHREENTNDTEHLHSIFDALAVISQELPIIIPLHPRTRARLSQEKKEQLLKSLIFIDPVPYLEMQRLEIGAKFILTDSGGIQKEAFFHKTPCITLRNETEWTETVESGWNHIVGSDTEKIISAAKRITPPDGQFANFYGDGAAADKIVKAIVSNLEALKQ